MVQKPLDIDASIHARYSGTGQHQISSTLSLDLAW